MKKYLFIFSLVLISSVFAFIFFSESNPNLKINQGEENADVMNIMMIGDYGDGLPFSYTVAGKMNEVAESDDYSLILAFGDNFYESGVSGLEDPGWNTKWKRVFQPDSKPALQALSWYGVIGNHDFRGEGLLSELEYNKIDPHWVIEDFFWTHTAQVGDRSIAFVHIDTNFLAYGANGETEMMKQWFVKLGWTSNEQMLGYIEDQLKKVQDHDWMFVMAHHQIGYSCPACGDTGLINDLLDKYNVDAYFSGHAHQQTYDVHNNRLYLLTGAGAKMDDDKECAPANPTWIQAYSVGFMSMEIHSDFLRFKAYHHFITGIGKWKEVNFPEFPRRLKNKDLQ